MINIEPLESFLHLTCNIFITGSHQNKMSPRYQIDQDALAALGVEYPSIDPIFIRWAFRDNNNDLAATCAALKTRISDLSPRNPSEVTREQPSSHSSCTVVLSGRYHPHYFEQQWQPVPQSRMPMQSVRYTKSLFNLDYC